MRSVHSKLNLGCVPTCFHTRILKSCQSVRPYPEKRNHPGFVNISPTLVIDTSMERSSRVLKLGNPKNLILFKKKKTSLPECFCCHVLKRMLSLYCAH